MKKLATGLAVLAVLCLGCGSGDISKEEAKKMEDSLAVGKGEFDINKVPPEHRAKVQGFIDAQKGNSTDNKTLPPGSR